VKNTRREFLSGLTKIAGGTVLGYVSLPLLMSCEPTSVPLEPELPSTPLGANGELAVNISALTQGNPAIVVPNFTSPADSFGVIVTLTPDGLVHALSMKCTHQGCSVSGQLTPSDHIVCPCHNSQFALDGSVLLGPATVPLSSYQVLPDPPVGGIANIKII
jgi:cytochrome b6-f complex iron-sulfur subunit